MSIEQNKLKNIIEAAMFAVAHPMSVDQLLKLFDDDDRPSPNTIKTAVQELQAECEGRGIELKEVASGYRYQAREDYSEWLSRLWEERPAKYSRAALETLALIAYRQPVTRAEIEDVRGVGVSSSIIKTMIEREWIRVVGHRDVPGRPALYATTKQFLDYFNMKSLDELPSLAEIKDLAELNPELDLPNPDDERDVAENSDEVEGDSKDQRNLLDDVDEGSLDPTTEINNENEIAEIQASISELVSEINPDEKDSLLEDTDPQENYETSESDEEVLNDELDDVHTESKYDSFYAEPEPEPLSEVENEVDSLDEEHDDNSKNE